MCISLTLPTKVETSRSAFLYFSRLLYRNWCFVISALNSSTLHFQLSAFSRTHYQQTLLASYVLLASKTDIFCGERCSRVGHNPCNKMFPLPKRNHSPKFSVEIVVQKKTKRMRSHNSMTWIFLESSELLECCFSEVRLTHIWNM